MKRIPCRYAFGDHQLHEYPDDWKFGGANGLDPRADPRWLPTTYTYYDFQAVPVWTTQTPLCDEQAVDEFTKIRDRGLHPKWIGKKTLGDYKTEMLPWVYDEATDEVHHKDQSV